MNIQINEVTLVVTVISACVVIVSAILGGGWKIVTSFKADIASQLNAADASAKAWRDGFMSMMQQHINTEEREFQDQANFQAAIQAQLERIQREYVTKESLEERLEPIRRDAAETRRIVDARRIRRDDPVSGRPFATDEGP